MSDTIITLNNQTKPMPIKYIPNMYGFSDSNNDTTRYLFELVINGKTIGKKYFRNFEDTKYSHLITLNHKIKLNDIQSYKVSVSIYSPDTNNIYELEGYINKNENCSTQKTNNLYIEFTKNDMGYSLCSCFYTGLDYNKIFASPPN